MVTCHLHWDPQFCDVKLIQTLILAERLQQMRDDINRGLGAGKTGAGGAGRCAVLLCGDFNSLPDSGVLEFINEGGVRANHNDFQVQFGQQWMTERLK